MNKKVAERIHTIRKILDAFEAGEDIRIFVENEYGKDKWVTLSSLDLENVEDIFSEFTDIYALPDGA